eukprot:scaffold31764_cov74-Phaeocystis_antarctica.AAC.2
MSSEPSTRVSSQSVSTSVPGSCSSGVSAMSAMIDSTVRTEPSAAAIAKLLSLPRGVPGGAGACWVLEVDLAAATLRYSLSLRGERCAVCTLRSPDPGGSSLASRHSRDVVVVFTKSLTRNIWPTG